MSLFSNKTLDPLSLCITLPKWSILAFIKLPNLLFTKAPTLSFTKVPTPSSTKLSTPMWCKPMLFILAMNTKDYTANPSSNELKDKLESIFAVNQNVALAVPAQFFTVRIERFARYTQH